MAAAVAALIALGGNLGSVEESFCAARAELGAHPQLVLIGSSLLYHTPPLGPPGQPDYLNAMLLLHCELASLPLLHLLQAIELRHGRQRSERWGARTLDLDLIDFGGRILDSPELILPHPELHRRLFVLQPLCDLLPDWHHPRMHRSASQLRADLVASGESPLTAGSVW